jgi:hypothetical protein
MSTPLHEGAALDARFRPVLTFVLDADDRVTYVSAQPEVGVPFLGQIVWERLPESEPLLRDRFDEARKTGEEIEFRVYYGGGAKRIRATPSDDALSVSVEPLTSLDVSTLATLAESLKKIEAELTARASAPPDRRAPSSPQALP